MKTLTLQVNQLKAHLLVAAKKDVLYYRTGVLLEVTDKGGMYLVSTDGLIALAGTLGQAPDEWTDAQQVIIPRESIEQALRGYKLPEIILICDDSGAWRLGQVLFKPVDGRFPEWRRVFPAPADDETNARVPVNPELMLRAAQGMALWCGGKHPIFKQAQLASRSMVQIHTATASAVVMGLREDKFSGAPVRQFSWE